MAAVIFGYKVAVIGLGWEKNRLNRLFAGVGCWPMRESANNVGIMLLSFNVDNTRDAIDELKGKGYPFISK